jgi:PAS domain S-box-containing protein
MNSKKNKAATLKELKRRYKLLFDHSMEAAYVTTPEGAVIDINHAALELFGFSREEFLNLNVSQLYVESNIREKALTVLEKKGFLKDFEYELYKKNKEKIIVRENCVAVKDGDKVVMYYCTLRDITQEKRLEEKLSTIYTLSREMSLSLDIDRVSELLVDAAKDVLNFDICALLLIDKKRNELYVKEYYGYDEKIKEFRMALDSPVGITAHVVQTGSTYYSPNVKKDKTYVDYCSETNSELCVPIKVGDKILGVIDAESKKLSAFSEDDRRLLETLAAQAAVATENVRLFDELSSLERFHETIVTSFNEGIWIEDEKGFCTYVNPKECEMLGYAREEIVGKHWTEFISPSEHEHVNHETETRKNGRASSYQTKLITKKNEKIPVIVSAAPLFKEGKYIGTVTAITDIQKQKKAEEDLKKSKEEYQTIFENLPGVAFTLDEEGRLLEANRGAEEVTGLRLSDYKEKKFSEIGLLDEKDLLKAFKEFKKNLEGEITEKTTYNVNVKNGKKILLELIGIPLKEGGKVTKILDVGTDVTKQREAERALRESQQKFSSLFYNHPEAMVYLDEEGIIRDINPRFTDLFGYTLEEINGKNINSGIVHPEGKIKEGKYLDKRALKDGYFNYETVRKKKDGTIFPVSLSGSPVVIDGKRKGIIGLYIDITERKKIEEKVSAIYTLSKEMSLSRDIDRISQIVLDTAEKILNFGNIDLFLVDEENDLLCLKECRGLKEPEMETRIPLHGKRGITAHVARTGEPLNISDVQKDKRYLLGLKKSRSELCVPLKVRDKIIGVLDAESTVPNAFSEDDRQLLETLASQAAVAIENAQLVERITHVSELQQLFISILSHDLKNPLTVIKGYEGLIKKHADKKLRRYIRGMGRSVRKIEKIISDAEFYSKLKEKSSKGNFNKINLDNVIKETLTNLEKLVEQKNIEMIYIPNGVSPMDANPLLEDVFLNLLDNAIKYSPEGSKVEVRVTDKGERWRVSVKDWGQGISDEEKDYIFERFKRGNVSVKGAGLGLAIVKEIVTLHDGNVWVEDNPEGGSMFVVELPKIKD